MESPIVKEVILSHKTRGMGTEVNPTRQVLQVHSKGGDFIAENDPIDTSFALFDLIHFAQYIESEYGGLVEDEITPDLVEEWLNKVGDK